tara:strand:- start:4125 stop:4304 length:180 start_codon:yes stop_codon:yes gene_type:complete
MKHVIDKFLNLTISKKLTVFIVSTVLVFRGNIQGMEWVYIALMYIGTQGAIDLYNRIKK